MINLGTIDGDNSDGGPAGDTIYVDPVNFTNQGTLEATGAAGLSVGGLTGNVGTVTLNGPGANLSLGGTGYTINDPLGIGAGQGLTLYGTDYFNTSTIAATNGGSVNLQGTFVQSDLGNLIHDASSSGHHWRHPDRRPGAYRRDRLVATGRR